MRVIHFREISEIFDFSNMDSSNVLKENTKEYARDMGTQVVALCLRLLCVKFGGKLRCVEGDTVKLLRDVRIYGRKLRILPSKRGIFF